MLRGRFRGLSREFQGYLKEVKEVSGCFKSFSRKFNECLICIKSLSKILMFCCCIVFVAASQAEGGLVTFTKLNLLNVGTLIG